MDDLPDLKAMPEIDRLRWLVSNMLHTPVTRAALDGFRWECPVCRGFGKVGTGKTESRRRTPDDPKYYPPGGSSACYDPSQWYEVTVMKPCDLCRGVGRLNHEPKLVQVVSEQWK